MSAEQDASGGLLRAREGDMYRSAASAHYGLYEQGVIYGPQDTRLIILVVLWL